MSTSDFDSYEDWADARDELDADRREDARMEEYDDAHPQDMRCVDCGETWHSHPIAATRYDPPECRYPECPACGGEGEAL